MNFQHPPWTEENSNQILELEDPKIKNKIENTTLELKLQLEKLK